MFIAYFAHKNAGEIYCISAKSAIICENLREPKNRKNIC